MAKETSGLEIVTLVVAILGVLLALASLVWQAATFALSGSRVRLLLRQGALKRMRGGTVRISGPLQPTASDYEVMRSQGLEEPVLIVEVSNRGRMAVSVENITAVSEDGWGVQARRGSREPVVASPQVTVGKDREASAFYAGNSSRNSSSTICHRTQWQ